MGKTTPPSKSNGSATSKTAWSGTSPFRAILAMTRPPPRTSWKSPAPAIWSCGILGYFTTAVLAQFVSAGILLPQPLPPRRQSLRPQDGPTAEFKGPPEELWLLGYGRAPGRKSLIPKGRHLRFGRLFQFLHTFSGLARAAAPGWRWWYRQDAPVILSSCGFLRLWFGTDAGPDDGQAACRPRQIAGAKAAPVGRTSCVAGPEWRPGPARSSSPASVRRAPPSSLSLPGQDSAVRRDSPKGWSRRGPCCRLSGQWPAPALA